MTAVRASLDMLRMICNLSRREPRRMSAKSSLFIARIPRGSVTGKRGFPGVGDYKSTAYSIPCGINGFPRPIVTSI